MGQGRGSFTFMATPPCAVDETGPLCDAILTGSLLACHLQDRRRSHDPDPTRTRRHSFCRGTDIRSCMPLSVNRAGAAELYFFACLCIYCADSRIDLRSSGS